MITVAGGKDMLITIKNKKSGNCKCFNCGKVQEGRKLQPYTVWYKLDNERRGHQLPVCSLQCAEQLVKRYKED